MPNPPTPRALIWTFVALVVLAVGSWLAASLGTGTFVALVIAAVKALLIAAVFMELARAAPSDRIVAAVAIGFVVLLCVGTLGDVVFR